MDVFLEMEKLASNDSNGAISGSDISNNMRSEMANQDTTINPHFHPKNSSNAELPVPDPQSDIDPLPLMKFQMRISMLFESNDADMKKILDGIRCVVQETQDSLHHHTMGCVFMESHCSDATLTEEKEMSLSKDSSINEELVVRSWIHDFVLVLGMKLQLPRTSPNGDVLSQKIQKFSATFDKVINSKISLLDFVLDLSCVLIKASELHFNVLGYKNNEAETNCSYCIDKVALPENKVVRDTSGDTYSNGCAHFSDSASDHEGSFISTFESNATTWKCLLEEFEYTKAQLQGTEQLLAEVKSQLASAQKLNSLAAEMYGRVIQSCTVADVDVMTNQLRSVLFHFASLKFCHSCL
ncbi:Filament-like plant protein 4 [Camellia lanceoleosa]|nr:Filament-like plant protein 4 [Camellia lanceoleosa]